jgi:hypothetical protein
MAAVHHRLRDLLCDARTTQRAVADAWGGVNEVAVSRFINHGYPKISLPRPDALAALLQMRRDEIQARIRPAPQPSRPNSNGYAEPTAADRASAFQQLLAAVGVAGELGVSVRVPIEV